MLKDQAKDTLRSFKRELKKDSKVPKLKSKP